MQDQNHFLTLLLENNSLFSAASVLSQRPNLLIYNTTASLDKLICSDYVNFGKCQDSCSRFTCSQIDSNFLDVNVREFKRDENRDLRLIQNLTMGEIHFNQCMRLRNQLVIAANFGREENLSPVLMPSMSKDIDEQLKLYHKVVDVVDHPYRKICVTCCVTMWTGWRAHML